MILSNSPVRHIPDDYFPDGSGPHWFGIEEGPDAGKQLFYFDTGEAGANHTVLFVHGNPESSYTYRHVVQLILNSDNEAAPRIVAMDHIGFGLSDQASFEMVDMHHAQNLSQLVRKLNLREITLVVHDWGGPIGIGALLDEPERVRNLVVLNSTVFPIPSDGRTFENYPMSWLPWSRLPDLIPDALWGAAAGFAVTTAPRGPLSLMTGLTLHQGRVMLGLRGKETPAQRLFREQFLCRINARSSKRMVRQTPVWGHGYRYQDAAQGPQDNHDFYQRIQRALPECWGPQGQNIGAAALFGAWDPLAKASVLSQWRQALPQLEGQVQLFADTSHFIEEWQPEAIARAIQTLLGR